MIAEIDSWCVTFSCRQDTDIELLCRLCLAARELAAVHFGAVNVLVVTIPKSPDEPPVPPYVCFFRFDKKDACGLLARAGIGLDCVMFVEVPLEIFSKRK